MIEPGRRASWLGRGWRVFATDPRCGKDARNWICGAANRSRCLADPTDAALVVSELFANALQHCPARHRVLVGYRLWRDGVRIIVCDEGGITAPQLRQPSQLDEGGRGLQVVDMIAARWGHFRVGRAQVVWCDLGGPIESTVPSDAWAWLSAVIATTARLRLALPRLLFSLHR